jgi:hypothetical protein
MSDDIDPRETLRVLPGQGWKALVFNYDTDRTARVERVIGWAEERDEDERGYGYFRPIVLEWEDLGRAYAGPLRIGLIHMWPDSEPDPSEEEQARMLADFVEQWQAELERNRKAAKA